MGGANPPKKRQSSRSLSQAQPVASQQGNTAQPQTVIQSLQYTSPIPPPEVLAQYNTIIPEGAERILHMAEAQSEHRQQLERFDLYQNSWRSWWGLALGFVIALTGFGCSTLLVLKGHDTAGATISVADMTGLVGVFVYGTRVRRQERNQRNRIMMGQVPEPAKSKSKR